MSVPQSAPSQSYPTQPKSPARGKYVAAIVVLSILVVGASGATAYLYYNPRTVTVDHSSDLNSLNNQIASLNSQISSDRTQIDNLNTRITQLQSQTPCTPDYGYTSCNFEIQSLQQQVQNLNSQVANLTSQITNLMDIVNLKKTQVVAKSVTINQAACGDTGQPSCNHNPYISPNGFMSFCSPSCYAGFLQVNWTSTQSLTVSFLFVTSKGDTTTTKTSSTGAGDFIISIPGSGSPVGIFSAGFHDDSCTTDFVGNVHCPSVSLTYSETYVY